MKTKNAHELATQLRPVLTRLVRKMRKLSPVGGLLSQTERSVLVVLEHQELLAAELAVMEKITPQSMGQVISKLSTLNLITKRSSEQDKRKIYLSISATGREMIQQVRNDRDEWLAKALEEVCSSDELAILEAAIAPMAKLVDF